MKKDEELLVDLLSYAKLAVRRARGRSQDELIMDKDLQSLLIHPLPVIGEAAKNLSVEFRQGAPEIPWEKSRECAIGSSTRMIASAGKLFGKP